MMRTIHAAMALTAIFCFWILLAGPGPAVAMLVFLILLPAVIALVFRGAVLAAFRLLGPSSRSARIREGWHAILRPPAAQRIPPDRAAGQTARCAATPEKADTSHA